MLISFHEIRVGKESHFHSKTEHSATRQLFARNLCKNVSKVEKMSIGSKEKQKIDK